jgi:tRNA threonylcarbamoyladenosine biosynthesis protein TsaE
MEFVVRSMEELERAARVVLEDIVPREKGATLVTLSGELGAGKTAFVQMLAQLLGVSEHVTSPTFIIEKEYVPTRLFERLVHIDAYRLKNERELDTIGWRELIVRPKTLVVLEWPERIPTLLKDAYACLTFDLLEDMRTIHYVRQ